MSAVSYLSEVPGRAHPTDLAMCGRESVLFKGGPRNRYQAPPAHIFLLHVKSINVAVYCKKHNSCGVNGFSLTSIPLTDFGRAL